MRDARGLAAAVAVLAALLAGAPAALADTETSSNWAGYVAHGPGLRFATVGGAWTVPSARCLAGHAAYSAAWVGIGGYSLTSGAVEQIGTQSNCTRAGRMVVRAWYELVPAGPRTLQMTVRPGDRILASVSLHGHQVRLQLIDQSRRRSFRRTLEAARVDPTSADWIVEAPSLCSAGAACRTLPLADFASITITHAHALTSAGRAGAVADRAWQVTRLLLTGTREAVASRLRPGRFTVAYRARVP